MILRETAPPVAVPFGRDADRPAATAGGLVWFRSAGDPN